MNIFIVFTTLLILLLSIHNVNSQVEGLYCGKDNCYELLGVTRDTEKADIMRSYRKLARVMHPDRQNTQEAKAEAEINFRKISEAYEILRNDEQRKEYDYMLDNPEEMYYHYYKYFRRQYGPKVDVRLVIFIIISLISIAQYYGQCTNYSEAIKYLTKEPKYRLRAKEIAKQDGLLSDTSNNKKRENGRKKTKEEIKQQEEDLIRKIIEEKMDIKGGYAKPSFKRVLWLQMFLFPYWLGCVALFWVRWAVLYWVLRRPYSERDQLYIVQRYLKMNDEQWDALPDYDVKEFQRRELWLWDNFKVYKQEKDDEMKEKLASDPNYKRYKRYLKRGGPGQITFGQDDVEMDY